jgi:mannonate dehydratase
MNRRDFLAIGSASAAALVTPTTSSAASAPATSQPAMMKLGDQTAPTNDTHLAYLARYGVRNICGYPQIKDGRLYATVDELKAMTDMADKYKISVDCTAPPFLESSFIDMEKHPAIMLAQSPERDRDIEALQTFIRNCAQAGIPSIKYNMSLLGVLRSGTRPGRGDAMDAVWNLGDAQAKLRSHSTAPVIVGGHDDTTGKAMTIDQPAANVLTHAGHVDADAFWERITYFLDHIIPVANEYKIRMACHPQDPGVPPEGYMGINRVLGTIDGLKRFISIRESPYHGLNFCQGTISENLEDPRTQIFDVIRYFGTRKKIFNVHFRNIRGHRNDFEEVFPDEGDIDFVKAIKVYKEVGYPYMLMPDHVPLAKNDPQSLQSFAFCYGYIRALIQSIS